MKSCLQLLVLLLVFCLPALHGQGSQNLFSNVSLHKVYFVNDHHGWILGSTSKEGLIFESNDGGKTWQQSYRSSEGFFNIQFADNKIGWAVGSNGTILRTSDGGANWTNQKSGVKVLLTGLAVLDVNKAWATGASGTLLYTNDGGETWNRRDINSQVGISDIMFLDSDRGWAVGYDAIFSTVDSGKTWTAASSGAWKLLSAVVFANRNLGWIAVGPVLLKTADGRKTWVETFPPSQGQLAGFSFVDSQHGWVVKSRGEEGSVVHLPGKDRVSSESFVLSTSDSGHTWQTTFHIASEVDHSARILNIFFLNRTNGWVVGRAGLILRTEDGGKNWQKTNLVMTAGRL